MHVQDNKLVMDRKDCTCQDGTQPTKATCSTCQGTGKGKRGKAKGCKSCFGFGYQWNHDKRTTCTTCQGNFKDHEAETLYDHLPDHVWQALSFKVYRENRPITFNEAHLALGCVYSCEDYGQAWNATDDAVLAKVKAHTGHQAIKVAKADGTLAKHIGVFINLGGYSVRPVF